MHNPDGEKVWISQYNVTIGNWCEYFTKFPCKSPFVEYLLAWMARGNRWKNVRGSSNWKNNCGEFLYLDCKGTRKANIAVLYTSSACIQTDTTETRNIKDCKLKSGKKTVRSENKGLIRGIQSRWDEVKSSWRTITVSKGSKSGDIKGRKRAVHYSECWQ